MASFAMRAGQCAQDVTRALRLPHRAAAIALARCLVARRERERASPLLKNSLAALPFLAPALIPLAPPSTHTGTCAPAVAAPRPQRRAMVVW